MISLRSGITAILCLGLVSCYNLPAQAPAASSADTQLSRDAHDSLMRAFQDPPNSARPRVWWHWMNGNIAPEGIKLDLEWMHRVGIGGVTIFEGAIATPQVVPQRLIYMTPEWKQAFSYAVTTARGLGLEVAIASSPGWSETGGPWVPAPQGIKKMVWSSTRVEGGKAFAGMLKHPPTASGTFQNFSVPGRRGEGGRIVTPAEFYADNAVIAYRIPAGDKTQAELNPGVTASGGAVDVAWLSDDDVAWLSDDDVAKVALNLPAEAPGGMAWVAFDYGKPQTIQAVTLATLGDSISVFGHDNDGILPRLESSDNGANFTKVTDIEASSVIERTAAFKAVTARYFRLVFQTPANAKPASPHEITELVLSSGARVNEFEKRAGYANSPNFYAIPDPEVAPEFAIKPTDVIDLTSKMKADGTLEWTPPEGQWMVLRIGYSLTGHQNGPAPAEATGLEVDKLDKEFVKGYLDGYLKMYADTVGQSMIGKDGISYMLTDSIEVGPQNWTDKMLSGGTVILPDGGEGLCNAVYVDDVIHAIFCALNIERAIPGPYLISGETPVTWAEYYRAFAKWIPGSAVSGEPAAVIESRLARQKFVGAIAPTIFPDAFRMKVSRTLQKFPAVWEAYNGARGRRLPPGAKIPPGAYPVIKPDLNRRVYPFRSNVGFMALRSSVSIQKAQLELGYKPQYHLAQAMEIVGPWLQWAGLAPR